MHGLRPRVEVLSESDHGHPCGRGQRSGLTGSHSLGPLRKAPRFLKDLMGVLSKVCPKAGLLYCDTAFLLFALKESIVIGRMSS